MTTTNSFTITNDTLGPIESAVKIEKKEAIIVKLIDIPNGQIAVLDNGRQINTKFLIS